ncbi:MAG TPA: hypothetical protein PKK23_19020 [Nitrospirales bacterium]|nr:hypothetical protein [Nitrospirales bacterium]
MKQSVLLAQSEKPFSAETEESIFSPNTSQSKSLAPSGAEMASPTQGERTCAKCESTGAPDNNTQNITSRSFVYGLGRIEARFPTLSAEKEFAQAAGRSKTAGLTDQQALSTVLLAKENRYLVRQLCWVFSIEGIETYLLYPRDPSDFDLLITALRPNPSPLDMDVVIGFLGPVAPPEMCNGLMVPILVFDQIYSLDRDALVKSIPKPNDIDKDLFKSAAEELFDKLMQLTDNAGAMDEHRAVNYLAVRYPTIYTKAAEAFAQNASLTAVDVRPSPLSGIRKVVDVIFSYTNRTTDMTEKFFVRVDVTEEFPFLTKKLSPYFDR